MQRFDSSQLYSKPYGLYDPRGRPYFHSREQDGSRERDGGSHSRHYFHSRERDDSRGGQDGSHGRPDFRSREQDGACGGHGGPHGRPDFRSRERDGAPEFDLRDAISGSAQKPQCHSDGHCDSLLQLIVSMQYQLFISGCQSVSFNDILKRLEETTPMAFNDVREFLLINQQRLEDSLKNVGLIQLPDMSWSAPFGLPPVEDFIPMVISAFSNSIYCFWNAKKQVHHKDKKRDIFVTESGKVITAIGVLFVNERGEFLMQSTFDEKMKKFILSDFGGKVERIDERLLGSLQRECFEETNQKLPQEFDFVSNLINLIYIEDSKYVLLICRAPAEFEATDLSDFGTLEEHSLITRTVVWVSVKSFLESKNLHARLWKSPEVKNLVRRLFPQ